MKIKLYVALVLLSSFIVAVWVVSEQSGGFGLAMGCTESVVSRTDSPDGKLVAEVFLRQCGATAPDTTQVNVRPVGTKHNAEKYPAFAVVDGAPSLVVRWDGSSLLVVSGLKFSRLYRQEFVAAGVRIEYE